MPQDSPATTKPIIHARQRATTYINSFTEMNLSNIISNTLGRWTLGACVCAALAATALTSCDSFIYDDEGDCDPHYKVRFRYDYNLLKANAFAQEVNAVTLYIVDPATGEVVWRKTEQGEKLRNEDYIMDVDGVAPGTYRLMAWAGDGHANPAHYTMGDGGHHTALTCTINRTRETAGRAGEEGRAIVDVEGGLDRLYKDLDSEFADREFVDEQGTHVHTVRLMRNTNDVHIVLQQLSGEPVDPDAFTYEITTDNGSMDWDNSLIDDEPLTYKPWRVRPGLATGFVPENSAQASFSAAIADFTVGRLVKGEETTLQITRKSDGGTVAKIPLIDYALMVKGHYDEMPDQEYLDRQFDYSMVFFLDEGLRWANAEIYINAWHVVLNNTDL